MNPATEHVSQNTLSTPTPNPIQAGVIFAEADANSDGVLTKNEVRFSTRVRIRIRGRVRVKVTNFTVKVNLRFKVKVKVKVRVWTLSGLLIW